MGFVNYTIELLRDPRAFIASMIATGPLAAYGFLFFLIVLLRPAWGLFPFLIVSILQLLQQDFFAHNGFNIVFACYYVGCCNLAIR